MSEKTYIGIDPGKSGGIGFIDPDQPPSVMKMPLTEKDLWDHFRSLVSGDSNPVAVIERVSSSPQMGVVSAFTFGMGYGQLRLCLVAAGIPFIAVTPQKWMAECGLRRKKDEPIRDKKNRAKALAQERFPSLKITHATAEAILIADYCRRHSGL